MTVSRAAARTICRRRIVYLQNTVIVGAGDVGQLIAAQDPPASRVRHAASSASSTTGQGAAAGLEQLTLLGAARPLEPDRAASTSSA